MIILESVLVLFGANVPEEDQKIIANWVEFNDDTGEQLSSGTQEIWKVPKDFENDEWNSKPADLKESDKKHWKNLNGTVKNQALNLYDKITKVIEDAVEAGDIATKELPDQSNKPDWMKALKVSK